MSAVVVVHRAAGSKEREEAGTRGREARQGSAARDGAGDDDEERRRAATAGWEEVGSVTVRPCTWLAVGGGWRRGESRQG